MRGLIFAHFALFSSIAFAFPQQPAGTGHDPGYTVAYSTGKPGVNGTYANVTATFTPQNTTATRTLHYYTPTPSSHLKPSDAVRGDPFGFHNPSGQKNKTWEPDFDFKDFVGEKAKLKPALDVRIDPSKSDNIAPGRNYKFPYISEEPPNDNTVVAADLDFEFDQDTVVLEHFYDLVDDFVCDSKTGFAVLTFTSKDALKKANTTWPVEDGFNIVAPLAGPNCDVPNQRGIYRGWIDQINEKTFQIRMKYETREWKDVAADIVADFAQLQYEAQHHEPKIEVRDVLHRKRGLFSKIKKAVKGAVKVVKNVVDKVTKVVGAVQNVISKVASFADIKWDPSVSFKVSVGPFGNADTPFGKGLALYDSTNGGWPKGLTWQQLNKQITAGVQTNLKGRDLSALSPNEFLALTADVEYERNRLAKRADPPWLQVGAWCVNCFAKAELKLAGHLKYNVVAFDLKELWITFGGNMEANIAFGLMLKSNRGKSYPPTGSKNPRVWALIGWLPPDLTHSKEIVRVPAGPGIAIPGIFTLGCTVPVTVGVTLHTDISMLMLVGANFKWPDMGVTINIKGGKGESHGWDPIITWTKPDLDDIAVSASVEVSATVAFEVGLTVLNGAFKENAGVSGTVGVGEKIIYNRPDLSSCTGLNLVTYIRVGINAYIDRVKTWSIWSKVWNIADVCLWPKKPKPSSTSKLPTLPPPTASALSSGAQNGGGGGAGNGVSWIVPDLGSGSAPTAAPGLPATTPRVPTIAPPIPSLKVLPTPRPSLIKDLPNKVIGAVRNGVNRAQIA